MRFNPTPVSTVTPSGQNSANMHKSNFYKSIANVLLNVKPFKCNYVYVFFY